MVMADLLTVDLWVYRGIMAAIAVSYSISLIHFVRSKGKNTCEVTVVLLLALGFAILSLFLSFILECYKESWCYYVYTI